MSDEPKQHWIWQLSFHHPADGKLLLSLPLTRSQGKALLAGLGYEDDTPFSAVEIPEVYIGAVRLTK